MAAGVVDEAGRVLDRERRETPGTDVEATEIVIAEVVHALAARHDVTAVGIGAAGWIANDNATVLFSPHLAWRDEPLLLALSTRIDLPLYVENDANAAAWAEYRFGAARGQSVAVIVTLGTGIGGALLIDGRVFRGAYGVACEYGHVTVVPDGLLCACGNRGCLEMYASGRALARVARELATTSPLAAERDGAQGWIDRALDGPVVTASAAEGDPDRVVDLHRHGSLARPRTGQHRCRRRPGDVRDRRRRLCGGGIVTATGPGGVRALADRARVPAAGAGRAADLGPDAGLVGAADLARTTASSR